MISKIRLWILPTCLLISALSYSLFRLDQEQYWDGAIGNLVATLIGIITGVPVALHLERQRALKEAEEKRREELRLKRETLTLLREELADNLKSLHTRTNLTGSVPHEPLKLSIWTILKESGDLRYVSEPRLKSHIAHAYRLIMIIHNLEDHFIQIHYGSATYFEDGQTAAQKFYPRIVGFYSPAITSVETALTSIETGLHDSSPAVYGV
jgi:hypothetical protein